MPSSIDQIDMSPPHALPLYPPDFVAMFERFPRYDGCSDGVLDVVLCVHGHCWSARIRLVYQTEKADAVAEVWLRHRDSALALFREHAEFQVWRLGERLPGRVLSIS